MGLSGIVCCIIEFDLAQTSLVNTRYKYLLQRSVLSFQAGTFGQTADGGHYLGAPARELGEARMVGLVNWVD